MRLEQPLELFDAETCVARNTAHRESVHRIMAGDGDDADAIGHDGVLTLPRDLETGLFERLDCVEMVDAGIFGVG
ncbi:MAG TPA: hypothetical protein VF538_03510 [Pyrinomonadaceae bacterium]